MPKPWVIPVASFVVGAGLASAGWTAFPPHRPSAAARQSTAEPEGASDDEALRRANQNLTQSLQACDRKLAEVEDRASAAATASAAPEPPRRERERDGGRFGRRRSREITQEDWERMAQLGVVRVRVPCIRDQPWTPTERVTNRLGLAPDDVDTLQRAYASSNKRVTEQVRPLCAKVLGSDAMVDQVGIATCIDVINNSARKTNAGDAKQALSRVAEVRAGKRDAPASGAEVSPLEQLGLVLTEESNKFERDLAERLGPDEAKRLANAPELCSDRRTLRASDDSRER